MFSASWSSFQAFITKVSLTETHRMLSMPSFLKTGASSL